MSFKSAFSLSNTAIVQYHIAKHQKILSIILSVSPIQIRPHIKDCVINQNKLLIYVDSAVWATQLRFFHAQIKDAVNSQSTENVSKIRIRIFSPALYESEKAEKKRLPSTKNIDLISHNAAITSDGKLKSALLSLSKTLQERSKKEK